MKHELNIVAADGTVIEDYYATEEVSDHTQCLPCDSFAQLTEAGVIEARKTQSTKRKWCPASELQEEIEMDIEEEKIDLDGGLMP